MQLEGIDPSICNDWAEKWNQNRDKIEKIELEYVRSLISLGFNPEGKDLLEIITFLANELNKTKAELVNFKIILETHFINSAMEIYHYNSRRIYLCKHLMR